MCIDLYVNKTLVYSNCLVDLINHTNHTNHTNYSNYSTYSPSPSILDRDNSVATPSVLQIISLIQGPSPSSTETVPSTPVYMQDNTVAYIAIALAVVIPCILWWIIACRKNPNKVQPVECKKKRKCCEKKSPLPVRSPQVPTATQTY